MTMGALCQENTNWRLKIWCITCLHGVKRSGWDLWVPAVASNSTIWISQVGEYSLFSTPDIFISLRNVASTSNDFALAIRSCMWTRDRFEGSSDHVPSVSGADVLNPQRHLQPAHEHWSPETGMKLTPHRPSDIWLHTFRTLLLVQHCCVNEKPTCVLIG